MFLYFSSPNLNVENMAEWLFLTRSLCLTESDSAKTKSWCWGRRESDTAARWAVPCTDPPGLSLSWVFFSQIRTMSSVRCGLTANLKGARVYLLLQA
jgi:hypothetical protein